MHKVYKDAAHSCALRNYSPSGTRIVRGEGFNEESDSLSIALVIRSEASWRMSRRFDGVSLASSFEWSRFVFLSIPFCSLVL